MTVPRCVALPVRPRIDQIERGQRMFIAEEATGESLVSARGAVVGIDVGWSEIRRSSAACLLTWTEHGIEVQLCRFTAKPRDVCDSLTKLVAGHSCVAAAIDGPLAKGFEEIGRYRTAERMLTRAFWTTIGKPGQSNSPNGILLNGVANQAAKILGQLGCVGKAAHRCAIGDQAIVEAFPTAYLGVMLNQEEVAKDRNRARSDTYYTRLTASEPCRLSSLTSTLLPGRFEIPCFGAIRNHDERAAVACALTALAITVGRYTAVGDEGDGWIILPPRAEAGQSAGLQLWAEAALRRQVTIEAT